MSHTCEDERDHILVQDDAADDFYDSDYPVQFTATGSDLVLPWTAYPGAPEGYYYELTSAYGTYV